MMSRCVGVTRLKEDHTVIFRYDVVSIVGVSSSYFDVSIYFNDKSIDMYRSYVEFHKMKVFLPKLILKRPLCTGDRDSNFVIPVKTPSPKYLLRSTVLTNCLRTVIRSFF